MTDSAALTDRTGQAVEVRFIPERATYEIHLAGDSRAIGHADFLDSNDSNDSNDPGDRIFHHTVVDPAFGGRGLAGILVEQALNDAKAQGKTVIPVCSYVSDWITRHDWDGPTGPVTDDVLDRING